MLVVEEGHALHFGSRVLVTGNNGQGFTVVSYRVPTRPLDKPAAKDKHFLDVAGVVQHVDIGRQIEDQIYPLNCCFSSMQDQNSLPPRPPEIVLK